jgi:hypothetical protein
MKNKYLVVAVLLIAIGFYSCSKDEGYGGLGKISGKVYGYDVTSSGNIRAEGYMGEVKIYISEHNNPNYFDDINTSYDGSFQFRFLNKGSYDLWVYSDCDTCVWKQKYEIKAVDISSKKQAVTVEDFKIIF